jgi:hypothetical protein
MSLSATLKSGQHEICKDGMCPVFCLVITLGGKCSRTLPNLCEIPCCPFHVYTLGRLFAWLGFLDVLFKHKKERPAFWIYLRLFKC